MDFDRMSGFQRHEDAKRPPVAVFAYRRPRHLELCLTALARCSGFSEYPLFIFCDGSRHEKDESACEQTRIVARRFIKRHGGTLDERTSNLGFRNITEGVSELCSRYGRVIVIEDDIVVACDFLAYMDQGLERYREDPRVLMISGYMFDGAVPQDPQLLLLPLSIVWGWATWQRAWQLYRYRPDDWQAVLADKATSSRFDLGGKFPFTENMKDTMTGKFDTWDTQWYYALFRAEGLGLYPSRSLIYNTGIGGGEHGDEALSSMEGWHPALIGDMKLDDLLTPRLKSPFDWPTSEEVDREALAGVALKCQEVASIRWSRRRLAPSRLIGEIDEPSD